MYMIAKGFPAAYGAGFGGLAELPDPAVAVGCAACLDHWLCRTSIWWFIAPLALTPVQNRMYTTNRTISAPTVMHSSLTVLMTRRTGSSRDGPVHSTGLA